MMPLHMSSMVPSASVTVVDRGHGRPSMRMAERLLMCASSDSPAMRVPEWFGQAPRVAVRFFSRPPSRRRTMHSGSRRQTTSYRLPLSSMDRTSRAPIDTPMRVSARLNAAADRSRLAVSRGSLGSQPGRQSWRGRLIRAPRARAAAAEASRPQLARCLRTCTAGTAGLGSCRAE